MGIISQYISNSYVPTNLIKVNGNVIPNLSGYSVEAYDLSKDAR